MDKVLTWFIRVWIALAILVNVTAIIGFFLTAPTFWAGLSKFWSIYSPFNLWNWVAEVVLILPAVGAYYWRDHRRTAKGIDPIELR
ncbi:MAG TPA: hypothetical protein VKA19_09340 [Alphaproteobacteria bacterium]|nr:hypothetical protein [Alphaproteobacteria bacterium]